MSAELPDREAVPRTFGRYVSARRAFLGMTQEQVAEASQVERAHISGIERGKVNPSLDVVIRLAVGLQIPVGDLIDGRDLAQVARGAEGGPYRR